MHGLFSSFSDNTGQVVQLVSLGISTCKNEQLYHEIGRIQTREQTMLK